MSNRRLAWAGMGALAAAALAVALLPSPSAAAGTSPPPTVNSFRLAQWHASVRPLRKLRDLFAALRACWVPPPLEQARPGMEISVRLSFKRDGAILGRPRITYQTGNVTEDQRRAYRVALAQSLARCTPLPFSRSLGNAIAGRPITIHFIDNRKLFQAEASNG